MSPESQSGSTPGPSTSATHCVVIQDSSRRIDFHLAESGIGFLRLVVTAEPPLIEHDAGKPVYSPSVKQRQGQGCPHHGSSIQQKRNAYPKQQRAEYGQS